MKANALLIVISSVVVLILSIPLSTTPTQAKPQAAFTVDSTLDEVDAVPGDGICASTPSAKCTLRAAIQEANAYSGADTVNIPTGVYTLTLAGVHEDSAGTGDLDVTDDLTIVGANAKNTVIDANQLDRAFDLYGPAQVAISNLTIQNGQVNDEDGGGIRIRGGQATLSHLIITRNRATESFGGGISNHTNMTLTHASVIGNTATDGGGGIETAGGTVTISSSTIMSNTVPERSGGGIESNSPLTLSDVLLSQNSGYYGGGIRNTAPLTIINSTVERNRSHNEGGGIHNFSEMTLTTVTLRNNISTNADGGGIWTADRTVLTGVTLDHNAAYGGGGISNGGPTADLTIVNSTLSGNTAGLNGGGGIKNEQYGKLVLKNTTLADNSTGVYNQLNGSVTLFNSIIAHSDGGNCAGFTPIGSGGHNLSSDDSCASFFTAAGDLNNIKPRLGRLRYNGGPTKTRALKSGSPAIDAGDPAGCTNAVGNTLTTDQRGGVRPVDGDTTSGAICDIGAFEFAALAPPAPSLVSPANGAFVSGDQVVLDWKPARDALYYRVIVRQDGHDGPIVTRGRHLTATKFLATLPNPGHSYFWRVSACNSFGCAPSPYWRVRRTD